MNKKRVGFISSNPLARTGFSNNVRTILPILYKKDKYDLFLLAQGAHDHDPNLQKMPWHTRGTIRPGEFNEDMFHRDPNYQKTVVYGNLSVQNWIIENKLDCVIHIEDIWSADINFYLNSKWWKYFQNNFLQWSTADSLPILSNFKTWAEKCSNMWLWATFGVNALHKENKEKYGHVKCVHGVLDTSEYNPINFIKKIELREKFNIDRDTIIFFKLGRSQLRKLYPSVLEAFSVFKKQYPQYKTKLHFHCSFSEGWPFDNLIEYYKIDKNDILATYYCRACNEYEIKPWVGEEQDCRFCHGQKTQITAGVGSSISNRELSDIYGISDACISAFTSGGLEFHNVQSLLCGLPLLSSNYSSGEDFTKNDFVFELDGQHTNECGTGFEKHVPNLNTIVKYMRKVCEMSPRDRQNIGKKGREWALQVFNAEKCVNELENFIDNCSPITWDYKIPEEELKNVEAVIPDNIDNKEWVKSLYKLILNMDMPDNDSGVNYWIQSLENKMDRNDVVKYFRQVAAQDNQKNNTKQQLPLSEVFKSDKPIILYIIKESLGDVFIASATFEDLKNRYSNHVLWVSCEPQYANVLDGNPFIDKVIPYNQVFENELIMLANGVKVYCHPAIQSQRHLNYLSNDKLGLKLE